MEKLKPLKLTFVNRKKPTITEPEKKKEPSLFFNVKNFLFLKLFAKFSAQNDNNNDVDRQAEEVGSMFATKKEKKAVQELEKMSDNFTLSKERCLLRITEINLQLKATKRCEANKSKLIALLKRRKQLERQIEKIESTLQSIMDYKSIVEDTQIDKDIMQSVVKLKKVVKTAAKSSLGTSADKAAKKVNKAVDELEDFRDDVAEFQNILTDMNLNVTEDEELMDEIESWIDEEKTDPEIVRSNNDSGSGNNGAAIDDPPSLPENLPALLPLPALPKIPEKPVVQKKIKEKEPLSLHV